MHLILIDEALANIAGEVSSADGYAGDRDMPQMLRRILIWMAELAERMGMYSDLRLKTRRPAFSGFFD